MYMYIYSLVNSLSSVVQVTEIRPVHVQSVLRISQLFCVFVGPDSRDHVVILTVEKSYPEENTNKSGGNNCVYACA